MLLLGIDTSGKSGGVTLAEGDERSFRLLESLPIAGGTFSAQLVPTIAAALEKRGFSVREIGGFAVVSGPGSFTGLRVGLSAVKGLAEILGKPIATVSLLEALAIASAKQGRVAAALDAGRAEVFFGLFQVSSSGMAGGSEHLLTQDQFRDSLSAGDITLLVTSDSSIAELANASLSKGQILNVPRPDSAFIAQIGLKKLQAGETVSVDGLDANYLRRCDAEIFSRARR